MRESNRKAMRAAVANYLANGKLPFVGTVYEARPEVVSESDYETNRFNEIVQSETGSGTVLVVNITDDKRKRVADTGRGAVQDSHIYKVAVELWFANVSGEGIPAQLDYDDVSSAIINLIRADATLNAQGVVWSAGEYETGIEHVQFEPHTNEDGTTILIAGNIRFDAWQWIAGPV